MFDTPKFLINSPPEKSSELPNEHEYSWERQQAGEPYPSHIVTFNRKDADKTNKRHLIERGLYMGLRATITKQNLYLLDISYKRYVDSTQYCVKQDWSSCLAVQETGPFWHEWCGMWGWIICDFLKQVEAWNKC